MRNFAAKNFRKITQSGHTVYENLPNSRYKKLAQKFAKYLNKVKKLV